MESIPLHYHTTPCKRLLMKEEEVDVCRKHKEL